MHCLKCGSFASWLLFEYTYMSYDAVEVLFWDLPLLFCQDASWVVCQHPDWE